MNKLPLRRVITIEPRIAILGNSLALEGIIGPSWWPLAFWIDQKRIVEQIESFFILDKCRHLTICSWMLTFHCKATINFRLFNRRFRRQQRWSGQRSRFLGKGHLPDFRRLSGHELRTRGASGFRSGSRGNSSHRPWTRFESFSILWRHVKSSTVGQSKNFP